MNTGRIAVYTALFGGYDRLQEPTFDTAGTDFICFTDDVGLVSRRWQVVHVPLTGAPGMMNRHVKLHPHLYLPDYEISVYVDANLRVVRDPSELVDTYLASHSFAAPRHHLRNCVYDEIRACVDVRKADAGAAAAQTQRYRDIGYPAGNGLSENRVLLRRHRDPQVMALMEAWWAELRAGVPRDQACLQVVCWRAGFELRFMAEDVVCGRHFVYQPHNHDGFVLRCKIHLVNFLKQVANRAQSLLAAVEQRGVASR